METLSLPPFDYKVKKQSGICLIFDIIRKKYVVLTPEEWVRQHVIHYLIGHKGYAPAAIAVERAVDLYGMSRRFDIVAFGKDGAPRLLIECKAPSVPLTRQVFDQAPPTLPSPTASSTTAAKSTAPPASSSSTTSPPPAEFSCHSRYFFCSTLLKLEEIWLYLQ